jgi:mRNA interferase HicA
MKRKDFLRYLYQQGCRLIREGREHSIWENPVTHSRTSIPRHRDIPEFTVSRICKYLGIPIPF